MEQFEQQEQTAFQEGVYDLTTPITPATVKISFDDFYNESIKKSEEAAKKVKYVNVDITAMDSILNYDLEKTDDMTLLRLIQTYYKDILDSLLIHNETKYIVLFQNPKFLMLLNQVLSAETYLDINTISHLNKLVYDYSVLDRSDKYIMGLMYSIARTINRTTISKLLGLGLPELLCVELSICRFSHSDGIIATKRLNNKIIQQSKNIMTQQMIVDIYLQLYTSMTPLFVGTMYDVYSESELAAFGVDADIINSTINLAILDLLESMTSQDIRKVLIVYAQDYRLNNNFSRVRFDITACPDYPRIKQVADLIHENEDIQIP